jgi:hypothetical protein
MKKSTSKISLGLSCGIFDAPIESNVNEVLIKNILVIKNLALRVGSREGRRTLYTTCRYKLFDLKC